MIGWTILAALSCLAPAQVHGQTRQEIVLWTTIENSTNPDDFRGYLDAYPEGTFAPLAKRRLETLLAGRRQASITPEQAGQHMLDRIVNAMGGLAALQAIRTVTVSGGWPLTAAPLSGSTYRVWVQFPDSYRQELRITDAYRREIRRAGGNLPSVSIQGCDNGRMWGEPSDVDSATRRGLTCNDGPPNVQIGPLASVLKLAARRGRVMRIDDHTVRVVDGGGETDLEIDTSTGLIVRWKYRQTRATVFKDREERQPYLFSYVQEWSDYAAVDGATLPARQANSDGSVWNYEYNVSIDPQLFKGP